MMSQTDKYSDACLVELAPLSAWQKVAHSSSEKPTEDVATSTSGILIHPKHGYVLTHGSILLSHFSKNKPVLKRITKSGYLKQKDLSELRAVITLDTLKPPVKTASNPVQLNYLSLFSKPNTRKPHPGRDDHQFVGHVQMVWKSSRFAQTIEELLPKYDGWTFFEEPSEDTSSQKENKDIDVKLIAFLMPYFVLIKLNDFSPNLYQPLDVYDGKVTVGDVVHIVGSPFGAMSPAVFMNSWSRGIVCNSAGRHQELIVTDARCIPGTEGGPLYHGATPDSLRLLGMIVSALCWKSNEWIGLSLACHIGEVLQSLTEHLQIPSLPSVDRKSKPTATSSGLVRSGLHESGPSLDKLRRLPVVLVKNGGSWGSGLIVDQMAGLVLSCGHVVKTQKRVKVRVDEPDIEWLEADVIHATPVTKVFDISVLQLRGYSPRKYWTQRITMADTFKEGDPCYVIGHAMFGISHNLAPSITSGVVSKVADYLDCPVMLQSTCTVNPGASGGPLVTSDGRILGIVTCNAKDTATGASYPNINLSVPIQTIWPAIASYIDDMDPAVLEKIHVKNKDITTMWLMQEGARNFGGIRSKL